MGVALTKDGGHIDPVGRRDLLTSRAAPSSGGGEPVLVSLYNRPASCEHLLRPLRNTEIHNRQNKAQNMPGFNDRGRG